MNNLKEKGHNINLTNIVIHRINKVAGNKDSTLKLAPHELKIGRQEVHFIADIRESFNKKSIPTHGIFEDAFDFNIFQKSIRDYKDGIVDFMNFTVEAMKFYKRTIDASAPATGGFIIFADFKITDNNNERYILILSINNKQGYNLSEDALSIQEIKNLELNKMDLATFVNISRWNLAINNSSDVKTYLSFIRGKKTVSDYFQNFIGCADKTTASDSSTKLLIAIDSYCIENGYDETTKREIKKKTFEYCQDCNKHKREILLSHIASLINDKNPKEFLSFAGSETYSVSEVIKYDGKVLRSLKFIEFQSDDFSIKINKQLIPKIVKINKEKKTLTLSNLPDELIAQF